MSPFVPSRRHVGLLAAALLAGCTSIPPPLDKHLTPAWAADKALVVVSVSRGRAAPGSSLKIFLDTQEAGARGDLALAGLRVLLDMSPSAASDVITLESAASLAERKIATDYRDRQGHVYVLEVPPGRHRFFYWYSALNRGRVTPRGAQAPLEFEVAKGEVVYLGNFRDDWDRFEVPLVHFSVPTAALVQVSDRSAVDIPIAERKNPAIAGKVRVALLPLGPWGRAEAPAAPASGAASDATAQAR